MSAAGKPFSVRVVVPAHIEFLHLVRLNVAGALGDGVFTVEEIEDIKIGVEELSAAVLRTGSGEQLDVSIQLDGDQATVTGACASGTADPVTVEEFVHTILDAVVDTYEVDNTGTVVTFALRKRARGR